MHAIPGVLILSILESKSDELVENMFFVFINVKDIR